jgi:adenylate kinase
MKLMIFGPPGSGKGTYSSRIQPILNVKRIATGDIYRDEMKRSTELGKKAAVYYNKGELVPDSITIDMLKGKLDEIGKKNFILDGFPRTVEQAKALEKIVKLDALILIIAPEEILIEKAKARRICSNTKCDGNYNIADIHKTIKDKEINKDIEYILPPLLPKKDGICDKCGGKLIVRREDADENMIKKRLKVYENQSKPILKYFKGKMPVVRIYMSRPPDIVVETIAKEIRKLGLK